MSTFDFFLSYGLILVLAVYACHKYRAWKDRKEFEEFCEPYRPSRWKKFCCSLQHHNQHLHEMIEKNNGVTKCRCHGCNTVFLTGRKIKIVLNKI